VKAKEKKQKLETDVSQLKKELIHLRKCLGEDVSPVDSSASLKQQETLLLKQLTQLRTVSPPFSCGFCCGFIVVVLCFCCVLIVFLLYFYCEFHDEWWWI